MWIRLWLELRLLFCQLPLAALVCGTNTVFCTHGGIPRIIEKSDVNPIQLIERIHKPLKFNSENTIALDLVKAEMISSEDENVLLEGILKLSNFLQIASSLPTVHKM